MKHWPCRILLITVCAIALTSCRNPRPGNEENGPGQINAVIDEMTNIMVHDVTNPPLASRFFAYACLAGYEVVVQNNPKFKSMQGVIVNYPVINKPAIESFSYKLAALFAMMETAGKMQPSGNSLDSLKQALYNNSLRQGLSKELIEGSKSYGQAIAKEILKFAKEDGYRKISDLPRYNPVPGDGYWYPTPPAFLSAVEPQFSTVRTFYLDSCSQFKPDPPALFDIKKGAEFYELLNAVYKEGVSQSEEHRQIASFWDCNPFAVQDNGHLQIGIKKISPGAHWMGIAGIACTKKEFSFDETMEVYVSLSTTLMDAFICCWDEKYRSNRIRPETAIRKYIDQEWQPLLQTPPFPEYLSGHSVISFASAEVLSHFFGDSFSFRDSTEVPFGLPIRDFASFRQAASEAAISRFYGGIHYMDAINNGQRSGEQVGRYIVSKLSGRK